MSTTEQSREMPEDVAKQTGTCMYYGQTMILRTSGMAKQDQSRAKK